MSTIQHQIRIQATPASVLRALGTIDGLSSWWTSTTTGACAVGDAIHFRFGDHVTVARVTTNSPDQITWTVEASNPDWVGTQIGFNLESDGDAVRLRFTHSHWRDPNDFFSHCNTKWAVFLLSLRDQVEREEGRPFPHDVAI